MRSVLIDAGPIIALFASDDRHRTRYRNLLRELSPGGLRLLTTWPCIVEAACLLECPQRFEMLRWIELGAAVVYPLDPSHLGDLAKWMRQYTEPGKREMDRADASLYWLAVETRCREIMTIDTADFSRYKLPGGHAFVLI